MDATMNNGTAHVALDVSDIRRAFDEFAKLRRATHASRTRYLTYAPLNPFTGGRFDCADLLNTERVHVPMRTNPELMLAICAEPAEDTPRLIYADWLDETAGEVASEFAPAYRAHAELIRLQCHMARAPSCPVCKKLGRFRGTHAKWCEVTGIDPKDTDIEPGKTVDIECPRCGYYQQHNRVRFLMNSKYAMEGRIASLPPPKVPGTDLWKPPELLAAKETRYVRGFVGIASYRLDSYLSWADKIVTAAPIQALYLSDRPLPTGPRVHGKIGYLFAPTPAAPDEVAASVELMLSPMVIPEVLWDLAHSFRTKDQAENPQDCYAWLSMACVTYARRRAGLPDILPPSASALHQKPKAGFPPFLFAKGEDGDGQPLRLPTDVHSYTSDGLYTSHALMEFATGDPDLLEYKGFCDARLLERFQGLFGVSRYPEWPPVPFG